MVPDLRYIRNGLVHFEDWTRGKGTGPQRTDVAAGLTPREVASKYSRFGYDPATDMITSGPYSFHVTSAFEAARVLTDAIVQAVFVVDQRIAADLRARTVKALAAFGPSGDVVQVSPGRDHRVWVSLATHGADRRMVSERVVAALAEAGLQLLSAREPQSSNPAERLLNGEALFVESAAQGAGEEVGVRG